MVFVASWLGLKTYFFCSLLALRATDGDTCSGARSGSPITLSLQELLRLLGGATAVHPEPLRKLAAGVSLEIAGFVQALFDYFFLFLDRGSVLLHHFVDGTQNRRKKVP